MNTKFKKVSKIVRNNIPEVGKTILDDISSLKPYISYVQSFGVCFKNSDEYLSGGGNWVIEIGISNEIISIELPNEMTEDHVKEWVKPIADLLETHKKSKIH